MAEGTYQINRFRQGSLSVVEGADSLILIRKLLRLRSAILRYDNSAILRCDAQQYCGVVAQQSCAIAFAM